MQNTTISPTVENAYLHSIEVGANTVAMPRLMTQKDLASYLHKSVAWCERARWAGDGPQYVKLGRCVRYRAEDVAAWLDQCKMEREGRA